MSRLLDRILNLPAADPDAAQQRKLAAAEYERACKVEAEHGAKDMDDTAQWAVDHPEVCR